MILHEGAEAGFYWGGKDATQILPPSPIVPLNEVLPYTGILLANSDPPGRGTPPPCIETLRCHAPATKLVVTLVVYSNSAKVQVTRRACSRH